VLVSIVVPAHNEAAHLAETVERVLEATSGIEREVIVVDDNSSDGTGRIADELAARHPEVRAVHRTGGNSFGGALKAGFERAAGDLIIPVIADLCDDPSTIVRMADVAEETGAAFVIGSRYLPGGGSSGQPWLKGLLSRGYSRVYSLVSGVRITDVTNAFKAYRRGLLDGMALESEWFDISVELPSRILLDRGGAFREIPTTWRGRTAGSSKFRLLRMGRSYLRWLAWAARRRLGGALRRGSPPCRPRARPPPPRSPS
jgi:glycosyltransferase involved in cell wall biosynthesis